jgi:hypothetical protein
MGDEKVVKMPEQKKLSKEQEEALALVRQMEAEEAQAIKAEMEAFFADLHGRGWGIQIFLLLGKDTFGNPVKAPIQGILRLEPILEPVKINGNTY